MSAQNYPNDNTVWTDPHSKTHFWGILEGRKIEELSNELGRRPKYIKRRARLVKKVANGEWETVSEGSFNAAHQMIEHIREDRKRFKRWRRARSRTFAEND